MPKKYNTSRTDKQAKSFADIQSPQASDTVTGAHYPPPEYQTLQALWNLRDDRTLSAGEVRVLNALLSHANESGLSWPSTATLAAVCRMGKKAVRAAVANLEKRDGPFRLTVLRQKTALGDNDSHRYTIQPGKGWIGWFKTDDGTSIQKTWNGRGWDHLDPRVGSSSTYPVGSSGTEGGIIQDHEEDTKEEKEKEEKEKETSPDFSSKEENVPKPESAMDREDVKEIFSNWQRKFHHPEMTLQPHDAKVIAATVDGLDACGSNGKNFCLNVATYIALAGRGCETPTEMYGDGFEQLLIEAVRIKKELKSSQQAAA